MDIAQLHIALKAVDFWALFGCIGLLIARVGLLPPAAFDIEGMTRAWHRLLGLTLILLTPTGVALLLVRVMAMGGNSLAETLPMLPAVLRQTHFGHIWALHLFGLLVLWIGWGVSWRRPDRGATWFMLIAAVLTAFTYSASSHAADRGDFTLTELNDWLHLLSASVWGGGILASALFIFPALKKRPEQRHAWIAEMVGRLSSLSALALALVLATGTYNAVARLGSVGELTSTAYGRVLAIKLALVAIMAIIGAANRFILVPRLRRGTGKTTAPNDQPMQALIATMRADVVLVLLILYAAAVLIQGMPPASMKAMPEMEHRHMHSQ